MILQLFDIIITEFDFAVGRHDVAVVTKDAFENCEKEKPISHMTTPPVKIMLNTTGPQYFICTVGDHCRFGQKLSINVVGAGGAATPGAGGGAAPGSAPGGATPTTPAGSTTPTGSSGTTTTPAGNAASSLDGATFLVAVVSAVVALFWVTLGNLANQYVLVSPYYPWVYNHVIFFVRNKTLLYVIVDALNGITIWFSTSFVISIVSIYYDYMVIKIRLCSEHHWDYMEIFHFLDPVCLVFVYNQTRFALALFQSLANGKHEPMVIRS